MQRSWKNYAAHLAAKQIIFLNKTDLLGIYVIWKTAV